MPYSPWVTKRRNYAINPQGIGSGASLGSRWFGASGTGTRSYNQSSTPGNMPVGTSRFARKTWTNNVNAAGSGDTGYQIGTIIPAVPGEVWSLSGWLRSSRAQKSMGARVQLRNGTTIVNTLNGPRSYAADSDVWTFMSMTFTVPAGVDGIIPILDCYSSQTGMVVVGWTAGDTLDFTGGLLEKSEEVGSFYSGDSIPGDALSSYVWEGTANNSNSLYRTRTYTPPAPVIPVKDLTTEDVLYNDRVTSYRWEVLEHSNGVDQLIGILDGVSNANLSWTQNVAVKGSGKLEVLDLDAAQAGMLRVADLKLESVRVRPVCSIEGLPENPLGVFLVSAAKEEWEDTGRVWSMELLDKCTVPSQDVFDQSYAVAAGTLILQQVRLILASCNEYIAINSSSTLATSSGMVWEAGTSKLKIINDLLDVAGYNALWMDGYGNFQATPRVLPADRSILYEVLGIPRELVDGEQAIYRPSWQRDRDSFEVPNKVIAVQAAGGGDDAALIGTWTNEDPNSPYSYQSRGRWIPHVLDSVECPDGTDAEIVAFLQKRAQTTLVQMSAVQAQVSIEHLPIPARVSDVVRFAHTKAGVDSRHVITKMQLDANPLGTMKTTLQEVITL